MTVPSIRLQNFLDDSGDDITDVNTLRNTLTRLSGLGDMSFQELKAEFYKYFKGPNEDFKEEVDSLIRLYSTHRFGDDVELNEEKRRLFDSLKMKFNTLQDNYPTPSNMFDSRTGFAELASYADSLRRPGSN